MRNIDRIHDLEAENRNLRSRLDAALESESRNAVEAHRWLDVADKEHQRVVQERERYRKLEVSVMQMEQLTSSLLAETAILCGEEDGDNHVFRIPCPDVSQLLDTWEVHTTPDVIADEYVIRARPRKPRKESEDAAAHDGAGVPADNDTGAGATEVPERQD